MEPSFITDENIPRVDPVIPNSTGGLLAEEWTIDPDSTLPSFLEMTMMDETRRQGYQTLKWVFEQMEERLLSSSSSSSSSSQTTATESTMISWWSRIRSQLSLYIANNILRPYGPELRFLIMYLLQRRSLLSNPSSATISEALYGGRRVKLGPSSGGGETNSSSSSSQQQQQQQQQQQKRRLLPMSKQDAIRLAFLYSFGPYLAERCEAIYRRLSQPSRQSTRIPLKLKKILKVIYPFLHMSVQGVHLLNRWGYLLGQSFFFDGYSRYLNLIVRRTTMEDQQQQSTTTTTPNEASATSSTPMDALKETILKSPKFRQVAIGILSSTAAMSWLARLWAARNDIEQEMRAQQLLSMQSQETKKDLFPPHPLPIPPLVLDSSSNNNNNNISYKACPICQLPRVNPTASTSGYVFCLKCLLTHIRTTPTCPVTGRPCPEKSIVQLFEPHLG